MQETKSRSALVADGSVGRPDMNSLDYSASNDALLLAGEGKGLVSPNPLVGCVIYSSEGVLVGKGTYFRNNVTHAEIVALEQAGERARGGTAYVSLEPHAHHGKTAPCTEALIRAGITRVVAPIEDPNPLVSGKGFDALRAAGIEVVTGILANEASKLNEKFICWHKKGRPFVHLKLAMSLDGRISLNRSVSTALSSEAAIRRVHEFRHEHDAILVGGNTALVDDPSLTDRSGLRRRRPLVRVILDNRLRLPVASKLATTARETPTVVISNSAEKEKIKALRDCGVEIIDTDARDLAAVLEALREREIQSVLVEGGTGVAGAFRDAGLIDKISLMVAPIIVGGDEA
ncbi:MAG TPA: bifunctional diaminohydroxyphosphoribosylaminopyrimidine deaminase/5-amino-6-(5-phosphoribosylamino)uracil reductase RibD, partial [Pyrinomonadaceae bacterium]